MTMFFQCWVDWYNSDQLACRHNSVHEQVILSDQSNYHWLCNPLEISACSWVCFFFAIFASKEDSFYLADTIM
jgi:hypothetical protein